MIAVGIDPSLTSTGVAVLVDGKLAHYGRYGRPGQNGASYTTRSRRVRRMIREVTKAALTAGRPDVFVIEEHPYAVGNQGNEFDRAAIWHGIYGNLDAHEVPGVVVNNSTGKAWVTGAGRASKEDVIAVIDDWYTGQIDPPLAKWRKTVDHPDDVADAIGYATMGAFKLGDPLPFEPKERHRTALALLPWPKKAQVR
ncbi:RuvC-like resolvase [Mycobacterium phage Jolene]|nr:RuvC-like resolvase [Mycobacterium phage Periodt]QYW01355.1 RuvC-like resolvase [Mycobacterium phage Jolene]